MTTLHNLKNVEDFNFDFEDPTEVEGYEDEDEGGDDFPEDDFRAARREIPDEWKDRLARKDDALFD